MATDMANGSVATANRVETPSSTPLTELVSGIVSDLQKLTTQQIRMLSAEFKEDISRSKQTVQYMGAGVGLAAVGVIFLLVSSVFLLDELTTIPLWGCWAIVGAVLTIGGIIAISVGKNVAASFNPLPDKTFNALQESIACITTPQESK